MISPLKVPRRKLNSNTNEILFEFEFTEPISFEATSQFQCGRGSPTLKFVFSKKATKIDEIFTVDLTLTT